MLLILCENANDISSDIGGGSVCGSDQGASNDVDDGDVTSCLDFNSEIWYSFTAPASGEILIDMNSWCGDYNPNFTLYEGSCGGSLNELNCSDGNGATSISNINLTAGNVYYLSVDVDDVNNGSCGSGGDFCFEIKEPTVPSAANICENATDISSNIGGGDICGNDGGATNDADDGDVVNCYVSDPDSEVWYSFTAPASGEIVADMTSWCGDYSPLVGLYEGTCGGGLTQIDCGDQGFGTQVSDYSLVPGDTYYLSIDIDDINNAGCAGGGDFCFTLAEPQEGDCLGSAKTIDQCGTAFTIQNDG